MKKTVLIVVMVTQLISCAGMPASQQSTIQGAGLGAVTGAIIGAIAGDAKLGALIGTGVGIAGGYIWSSHLENQKKQLEEAVTGTGISVSQTTDNQLKLNIPTDISFNRGRAEIKPEMYPVLNNLAVSLKSNPVARIRIVGHTDSTENDAINNPLSANRAASTRDYLVRQGIRSDYIKTEGQGARDPVAPNDSPGNRAKNRRVEIFVYESQ